MKANEQLKNIFDAYKKGGDYKLLINDFVAGIIPSVAEKDPSWNIGAGNLIKAVVLSLLENKDVRADDITIEKIKATLLMGESMGEKYDSENHKQAKLIKYFNAQSVECRQLVDGVIGNAYNTFLNFICMVYTYLATVE